MSLLMRRVSFIKSCRSTTAELCCHHQNTSSLVEKLFHGQEAMPIVEPSREILGLQIKRTNVVRHGPVHDVGHQSRGDTLPAPALVNVNATEPVSELGETVHLALLQLGNTD